MSPFPCPNCKGPMMPSEGFGDLIGEPSWFCPREECWVTIYGEPPKRAAIHWTQPPMTGMVMGAVNPEDDGGGE